MVQPLCLHLARHQWRMDDVIYVYFLVSNCDAVAATAKGVGAKLYMPPMTVENLGRMAIITPVVGRP
jgi:predicted enzyme related to lactoylglutathione lyase